LVGCLETNGVYVDFIFKPCCRKQSTRVPEQKLTATGAPAEKVFFAKIPMK
jgi:hypothetical protein